MQTKTYFASSIQAAMDIARKELGPEALLVDSKPASEAGRAFGRLEVTFAWEAENTGKLKQPTAEVRRAESGLEEIRLEISALRQTIGRAAIGPAAIRPPATGTLAAGGQTVTRFTSDTDDYAVASLCEGGFAKDMAQQIVSAAARRPGGMGDGILQELAARIPVAAFSSIASGETRTLAFVGPSGRGKTSSLIKIAVRYGVAARVPVRIFMGGAHGVGATEQMARYASILGVPFQSFESFDSLNLALQGGRWNGLVLIDTPGTGDRQEMEAMERLFSRRTDIERHLVLRAEARSADSQNMLAQFAPIRPSRLLFTGLDEATGLGGAADTMIRSGIAAMFFGTGPRIPDDLEEVDVAKLARTLWAAKGLAARAA